MDSFAKHILFSFKRVWFKKGHKKSIHLNSIAFLATFNDTRSWKSSLPNAAVKYQRRILAISEQ